MKNERLTPEEFEALRPRLGRHTVDTVDLARRVLVDGNSQSQVAKETGYSRQRIYQIVRRVRELVADVPPLWEQVSVWLPPEQAAKARQMAIDARDELYRRQQGTTRSHTG